jgi:hypothetical protein
MSESFQVGTTQLLPAAEPETGPCPSWCRCRAEHPASPYHVGAYRAVVLSLAELYPVADLAADLYVRLERGFRSAPWPRPLPTGRRALS